ncbi:MAG: type II toxin-antitoxin system prevent-host-death family antitoxin [Micrococcales bacterium]|nr:type II toxin-antitoxin system prevent-host-death family antitoxin [Micrococcales bacterium]
MAQTVTTRELNQQTSAILAKVREGEEVVVTFSGRPQARIIPFASRNTLERRLAEGRITPPTRPRPPVRKTISSPISVDDLLAADREDWEPTA